MKEDNQTSLAEYVFEAKRYYLQHSNYDAVASSTLPTEPAPTPDPAKSPSADDNGMEPEGERNYDVNNIKGLTGGNWAEGVDGDGIGENITLTVHRPLPLASIMIRPGYHDGVYDRQGEVWAKKNRVAGGGDHAKWRTHFRRGASGRKNHRALPDPSAWIREARQDSEAGDQGGASRDRRARYLHLAGGAAGETLSEAEIQAVPVRRLWVATVVFGLLAQWAAAGPITVPIYIEDNHAGSFYWLAEHLDLDEELTLIHFDAHTDASGIFDSDKLRERLRRVGSLEERRDLLERCAERLIQCFNWIEPLMPSPCPRCYGCIAAGAETRAEARGNSTGTWSCPRAAVRSGSVIAWWNSTNCERN